MSDCKKLTEKFEGDTAKLQGIKATRDWCMRMAELEGDQEIGAGRLAADPDIHGTFPPVTDHNPEATVSDWQDAYWRECVGEAADECKADVTGRHQP